MQKPTQKPNYQPSRATALFSRADENSDAITLSPKAQTTASAAVRAVLADITNNWSGSDSPGNDSTRAATANSTLSDTPAAASAGPAEDGNALSCSGDVAGASAGPAEDQDEDDALTGSGDVASSTCAATANGMSSAADHGLLDTPAAVGSAEDNDDDVLAGSGGVASAAAGTDPLPPRKKKRSEMGVEERRLMKQAAQERLEKLSADIGKLLEEQEELFVKYAQLNEVSVDRVKKLAHQLPSVKSQKKASDYNILVYFKGKELNAGKSSGSFHFFFFLTLELSSSQGLSHSSQGAT